MARNPLPSDLKRLKGTLRPCRENRFEPRPDDPIGDPPGYLEPRAREIWQNVLSYMPKGVIMMCDSAILETYCNMCALREKLQTKINKEGVTIDISGKVSPAFRALKDVQVAIMQSGSQLGLTPSSRQKVAQGYGDPTNDDDSTGDLFGAYEEMGDLCAHA